MTVPSGNMNLDVMQSMVEAIHEHTAATNATAEALVADQSEGRRESDRRFNKQARKLRVLAWAVAALIALAFVLLLQQSKLIDETRQEAERRESRAQISEAQRKCVTAIQNATLARLAMLATSTPNRVNGSTGSADPATVGKLREDLVATNATTPPDPAALLRVRDDVSAILAAISPDSPESRALREEIARANDALLRSNEICFTSNPPADPLGR